MSTRRQRRPSVINIHTDAQEEEEHGNEDNLHHNLQHNHNNNNNLKSPKSPTMTPKVARRLALSPLSSNTLYSKKQHGISFHDSLEIPTFKRSIIASGCSTNDGGSLKRARRTVMSLSPISLHLEQEENEELRDDNKEKRIEEEQENDREGLAVDRHNIHQEETMENKSCSFEKDSSFISSKSSPTLHSKSTNHSVSKQASSNDTQQLALRSPNIPKMKSPPPKTTTSFDISTMSPLTSPWHLPQIPQTKHTTLRQAYKQSISSSQILHNPSSTQIWDFTNETHQQKLTTGASNLLSLDEVILPSMIKDQLSFLKVLQGKAKGRKDLEVVDRIKLCRAFLLACEHNTKRGVVACRQVRQGEKDLEREEVRKVKQAQKAQEKQERHAQRLVRKQQRQEKAAKLEKKKQLQKQKQRKLKFKQAKKEFPRNQELWREVAFLMTSLTQLEQEEQAWLNSNLLWKEQEEVMVRRDLQQEEIIDSANVQKESNDALSNEYQHSESKCINLIDQTTNATNQLCEALEQLTRNTNTADNVRWDLYQTYKNDFQFHGYFGVRDPKALIRAIGLM